MIDPATLILTREPEREAQRVWGKWNRTPRTLKSYSVVTPDGKLIGRVYQSMVTFDIKPKGSRIVTKRWESPRWRAYPFGGRLIGGWQETRKAALEVLAKHVEETATWRS